MGIRVHKVVGWGLGNLEVNGSTIIDKRLNAEHENFDLWDVCDIDGFLDFYDAWDVKRHTAERAWNSKLTRQRVERNKKDKSFGNFDFLRCFHMNAEYGLPVLCVQLLSYPTDLRSADSIDWVEETYCKGKPQENWVKILPENPYPHNGFWMDDRINERMMSHEAIACRRLMSLTEDIPSEVEESDLFNTIAEEAGFKDFADAKEHMVPYIPDEIRAMCEFTEVFADDSTINDLRPMLYCYWS